MAWQEGALRGFKSTEGRNNGPDGAYGSRSQVRGKSGRGLRGGTESRVSQK